MKEGSNEANARIGKVSLMKLMIKQAAVDHKTRYLEIPDPA